MSNADKLVQCFAEALGIDPGLVVDTLSYDSIPQWDSVAHMALVTELEAVFDVMLDTDEILALSSPERAREILNKHGVSF
jgi:acyl carrier protein